MKLFIAGLSTETNTFSPMPTGLADYVQVRGVPEKDPNSFEAPMSVWKRMARERGWEPAAVAVAWVASHPAVTAPLLGARSVEQLEPSLGAIEIPMTSELRAEVSALTPAPPPATDRNEEGSAFHYGAR